MTDNEIIEVWEHIRETIELDETPSISIELITNTLDLINRQKAELGIMLRPFELQVEVSKQIEQKIKAEAIKEFAERLKAGSIWVDLVSFTRIDNILKEMVGDKK